jgi:hypothetical protein
MRVLDAGISRDLVDRAVRHFEDVTVNQIETVAFCRPSLTPAAPVRPDTNDDRERRVGTAPRRARHQLDRVCWRRPFREKATARVNRRRGAEDSTASAAPSGVNPRISVRRLTAGRAEWASGNVGTGVIDVA